MKAVITTIISCSTINQWTKRRNQLVVDDITGNNLAELLKCLSASCKLQHISDDNVVMLYERSCWLLYMFPCENFNRFYYNDFKCTTKTLNKMLTILHSLLLFIRFTRNLLLLRLPLHFHSQSFGILGIFVIFVDWLWGIFPYSLMHICPKNEKQRCTYWIKITMIWINK